MNPRPGLFSTTTPNFPVVWDSTMLGLFKECGRKFQFQILLGKSTKGQNIHLTFGLLYHAGLERYDHARAAGASHDAGVLAMVRFALNASGSRDAEGTWSSWESGDSYKNRYTLIRSLVWYVEENLYSAYQTVILANGKPAVELSFKFAAFTVEGEPISLAGHMDKLVSNRGETFVADHKTTKSALTPNFYNQFTPHNQFTLYTIAGKVTLGRPTQGVLVNAASILVNGTRFGTRPIPRPPAVLDEWLEETQWWIAQARAMAVANHWPGNDKSCLAGDAVIKITRGKMKGRTTTIENFYKFFHNQNHGTQYDHSIPSFALCDVGGHAGLNQIVDVLQQGEKETFNILTESGQWITATADHQFLTPQGWKRLDELQPGSTMTYWAARSSTRQQRKSVPQRAYITSIPYHPHGHASWSKGKNYKRMWKARAVVEARMNNLTLEAFVNIIRHNPKLAERLIYIEPWFEVHHKDRDCTNDDFDNLEVLRMKDHKAEHKDELVAAMNQFQTEIVAQIIPNGVEMTYDLVMAAPHHNFIANGFVAHNCNNYGGCAFAKVCGVSPSHRDAWLRDDFAEWSWNPLESRGDI